MANKTFFSVKSRFSIIVLGGATLALALGLSYSRPDVELPARELTQAESEKTDG